MSAAVAYREDYGVVSMGFPFESLVDQQMRDILMKRIINYLLNKEEDE
jgi:hypothetical protein